MQKYRSFLKGLGTGVIIGAVMLQLMLLVQNAQNRVKQPGSAEQPSGFQLTAEFVKEKADSLNLQVYDKGIPLYDQKQVDELVSKARAEAATATPDAGPKQITIYISEGMSAAGVVDYLHKSGVVVDRLALEGVITQQQVASRIRFGIYTFYLNEKIEDVVAKITSPVPAS